MPPHATPEGSDETRVMFAFAHDLRTHLRTVLTRIQLVQFWQEEQKLPEHEKLMLQEAASAVADCSGLINAMTAYCDVTAGEGVMDLRLMLRGILVELKTTLANAGAVVEGSNDLDVSAPAVLQGVLKELLTNACKFRDPSRPLRIHIASRLAADNTLEIAVTDTGIGVAPMYLEKIFLPFQRLHSRDEFPGNGLGLATCRRIAVVCGGSIAAEAGPDGGLTVHITVPLSIHP